MGTLAGYKLQCKECGFYFWICKPCYRRQRYCSEPCRKRGYDKTRRTARKKYDATWEARLDHRDRQQRYRDKKIELPAVVTDQSSKAFKPAVFESDNLVVIRTCGSFCAVCKRKITTQLRRNDVHTSQT